MFYDSCVPHTPKSGEHIGIPRPLFLINFNKRITFTRSCRTLWSVDMLLMTLYGGFMSLFYIITKRSLPFLPCKGRLPKCRDDQRPLLMIWVYIIWLIFWKYVSNEAKLLSYHTPWSIYYLCAGSRKSQNNNGKAICLFVYMHINCHFYFSLH